MRYKLKWTTLLMLALILSGCAGTVEVVLTEKLRPTVWLKQGEVAPWGGFLIEDKVLRLLGAEIDACRGEK